MRKAFELFREKLRDPSISYEERTMVMLAFLGETALIVALIFDILGGEHIVEIVTLAIMIAAVPIATGYSVYTRRFFKGIITQCIALVFVVLPILFFYGGGPRGGGVFWVIFSYMFIGMLLSGSIRIAMMIILTAITIGEYAIWFHYPDTVIVHTNAMFCIDAMVSVVLVGLSTFAVLRYQKLIFSIESERAKKQAERAEELNRSQNQFFSSMSHEIRTPINSILGLNEIILRQDDASDEIRKDAANIQGAGRMLLALVNDILDLSKIEAGKMDIVPVNYSMSSMASEIVNMIWLRAEQKGLKFEVDIDPTIPSELYGDEVRIKQILINLLNNAVKYTSEGTITLHVEKELISEDKAHLIFSVTDTGMGIKQESLPYLFDAFQRVDEEKNRHIEGTGLGLSIVKQLVDLMEGTISVNSVYSQGTTFTVSLWQGVTNPTPIGDLSIANFGSTTAAKQFESSFTAPDARILIVDDNEMNLEVERKLIASTEVQIDLASSGDLALYMTANTRYDLIFMDHLMPGMDGIDCLIRLRKQKEEVNNNTPVVVLTANAGGENKELYARSGFDGYLLKPVSGKQLEETMLNILPEYKIRRKTGLDLSHEVLNTSKGYRRKVPVLITTSSLCDLPHSLIREMQLDVISFLVHTDAGTFYDNVEADTDELLYYMYSPEGKVWSEPPKTRDFEEFFASRLQKAHHIIHISITPSMSEEYARASKAARQFDNVTVVDSGVLSSAMGFLVMAAHQMAQQNQSVERITEELEKIKSRMHCSFVVAETRFMVRGGYMSERMHKIMATLNMRPLLQIKKSIFTMGWVFMGEKKLCYHKYIKKILSKGADPDLELLLIAYVGMTEEELSWIAEEVKERFPFKHIFFQKASAAIAVNSGMGTFGLLYMDKSDKSFHLDSLISDDNYSRRDSATLDEDEEERKDIEKEVKEEPEPAPVEMPKKWYETIGGIDVRMALTNSGSEDAFLAVLKIFYDSIDENSEAIQSFYDNKDYDNYTIKVHALKSSAKLVGIPELSEQARHLEDAGKQRDIEYIENNHAVMMSNYLGFKEKLAEHFDVVERPVADELILESAYEALLDSAKIEDEVCVEGIFKDLGDYIIPEAEQARFEKLKAAFERRDYQEIINELGA
ncbi:DegV family protein [Butyrivibrio sp. MC2021]|uniref:DegV family protein n=1 Tax=Butyrivibrio sp. MC2021 TaxID=1408306 RepID=UPI0009DD6D59|nr:DegV family protein [Butyrivibrio sp. MC2021]